MRSQFSLFQSHLDLSHRYWQQILKKGDVVIDATCGNGKDTLYLASLVLPEGHLYAMDIQEQAILQTRELLSGHDPQSIDILKQSHITFPKKILPNTVKGIIYNFGYLPGSNKAITTDSASSLESVMQACPLVCSGGFISLTCYPGHAEGAIEESILLNFCQSLPPQIWNVCYHQFYNRDKAPSLIFLQKQLQSKAMHPAGLETQDRHVLRT